MTLESQLAKREIDSGIKNKSTILEKDSQNQPTNNKAPNQKIELDFIDKHIIRTIRGGIAIC